MVKYKRHLNAERLYIFRYFQQQLPKDIKQKLYE